MLLNIYSHWKNKLKNKKYMDLCNIYSSRLLQKKSSISNSLVFFVESLTFIKLKKINVFNNNKYFLFSVFSLKVVSFFALSGVLFITFGV